TRATRVPPPGLGSRSWCGRWRTAAGASTSGAPTAGPCRTCPAPRWPRSGPPMLTDAAVERILDRIPTLTVGVLGDLFLDRYLDIDAALTEPSIETGLDAYQVVQVRSYPGAAGTGINKFGVLGVGRVCPVGLIADGGVGYERASDMDTAASGVAPGG